MTDDYVVKITNGTNAVNEVVYRVLNESASKTFKEHPVYVTYSWNLTAYEHRIIYEGLIDNFPILLTVYNPKLAGPNFIKVKVPDVDFDVLD